MANSVTSAVKDGFNKVSEAVTPKPHVDPANDPTVLSSKGRPGPELYMALARLYEQSGKLSEAAAQYEKALKDAPKDPNVLAGCARLKVRMGQLADATDLYQRAAGVSTKNPSVLNDLGLCYARRGMNNEAVAALGQAIQLQPNNPLYRNNIAAILVEMGRNDAAFSHLRAVHSEAIAHYNLGYLLKIKGQSAAAVQHFSTALQKDPSLVQARHWLQRLGAGSTAAQPATAPMPELRLGSRPAVEVRSSDRPIPLPPTDNRGTAGTTATGAPAVPGEDPRRTPAQAAPGLRRLPGTGPRPQPGAQSLPPGEVPPMPPDSKVVKPLPAVSQTPRVDAEVAPLPGDWPETPPVPVAPLSAGVKQACAVQDLPPTVVPLPNDSQ